MEEITNADSFEMNMNSIFNAVLMQIYERENVDYCSEETNLKIQGFVDFTSNLMALDEKSKISITNELDLIINISNSEMPKLERRCTSADEISDAGERLINYMQKTFPYLSKEQKFELQGRMETLMAH